MTPITLATDRQPWEQQPDEPGGAFKAFEGYLGLGAGRTLGKATRAWNEVKGEHAARSRRERGARPAQKPKEVGASGQIRTWAKDYKWEERATAHDHYLAEARDRAKVKIVESREMRLAKRAERADEETLVAAEQLKLQAFQMLQGPLETVTRETRTESPDGHTTIVHQTIEPARWSKRDAATMLRLARDLEDAVLHPDRNHQPTVVVASGPQMAQLPTSLDLGSDEQSELEQWRAHQRTQVIKIRREDPREDAARNGDAHDPRLHS